MHQDPRMDPNTANVIDHDLNQSFTQRSLRAIAGIAIALFCLGGIVSWFFMGDHTVDDNIDNTDVTVSQQMDTSNQAPGNEYAEGSGRSATYDFFYAMFGGIEEGLEDNPHNLKNVEHIDQMNFDADEVMSGTTSPSLALKDATAAKATNAQVRSKTIYRHSMHDVVGSRVIDKNGKNAGEIYDVMVNKETGAGKAIIIQEDESYYERDLKAIGFKAVDKKQKDGDTFLTITEDALEKKQEFEYTEGMKEKYVSLRRLSDGELIDFEGNVAGNIEAVIYQNAEAQNIYFSLRPGLTGKNTPDFSLPFEEVKIIESPDGLDIQLNEEQTKALAKMLF
jgi:sporulation protein YlmC with PRC-barrel domain